MPDKTQEIFVSGIGTDVGKTVVSAILVEALQADYWKPIQAGDLEYSDTDKVRERVANSHSVFHDNAYALTQPMSPHAAAERDGVYISLDQINKPKTENHMIIEGAGGLLVPLNDKDTILDLIQPKMKVILVANSYLGSINHTLLSTALLQSKGLDFGIIFNGKSNPESESIIEKMSGVKVIARISELPDLEKTTIADIALNVREQIQKFIADE